LSLRALLAWLLMAWIAWKDGRDDDDNPGEW